VIDLATAAQARALASGLGDRPSHRRCAEAKDAKAIVSVRATGLQVRAASDDGPLTFEGYASVTGVGYEMYDMFGPYTEMVAPGAFADTRPADLDVPLVLGHDSLRRLPARRTAPWSCARTPKATRPGCTSSRATSTRPTLTSPTSRRSSGSGLHR
jgi:hypothetical protein